MSNSNPIECDFSVALMHVRNGGVVTRNKWNGKGMWICLSPGAQKFSVASI